MLFSALALRDVARGAGHTNGHAVGEMRTALRADPALDPVALADNPMLHVVLDRAVAGFLRLVDGGECRLAILRVETGEICLHCEGDRRGGAPPLPATAPPRG